MEKTEFFNLVTETNELKEKHLRQFQLIYSDAQWIFEKEVITVMEKELEIIFNRIDFNKEKMAAFRENYSTDELRSLRAEYNETIKK